MYWNVTRLKYKYMFMSGHICVLSIWKPHFQCNANWKVPTTSPRFCHEPLLLYCTFFSWRLRLAPTSHSGQSTTLLWLERSSSTCAKLPTVAPSNNTVKIPRRDHFISACSCHMGVVRHAHPVRGESPMQHNANWEVATLASWLG